MQITYAIVSGSHRQNSESFRVAEYVKNRAKMRPQTANIHMISLAGNPLPI